MDYTDVIAIISQFVNTKAVVLAVAATQLLKYVLPSPSPDQKFSVPAGAWYTRLIPVAPLLIGTAICVFIEKKSAFVTEDIVRGVMSGILAAWAYRTTKVTIFGQ